MDLEKKTRLGNMGQEKESEKSVDGKWESGETLGLFLFCSVKRFSFSKNRWENYLIATNVNNNFNNFSRLSSSKTFSSSCFCLLNQAQWCLFLVLSSFYFKKGWGEGAFEGLGGGLRWSSRKCENETIWVDVFVSERNEWNEKWESYGIIRGQMEGATYVGADKPRWTYI